MTTIHECIQTRVHDKDSLQELRDQGASISLSRVVVAVDEAEYHFHDLRHVWFDTGKRRTISHYPAIGPGGVLQIVSHEQQTWAPGSGPTYLDIESGEVRPVSLQDDWSISWVLSPSRWRDVAAFKYGQWIDENSTKKWFDSSSGLGREA